MVVTQSKMFSINRRIAAVLIVFAVDRRLFTHEEKKSRAKALPKAP